MGVHVDPIFLQKRKKIEVCRHNHVYYTYNWIRSDPNRNSLGLGARFRAAGTEEKGWEEKGRKEKGWAYLVGARRR